MTLELEGRVIFFATNNIHKFNEARLLMNEYKISMGMLRIKSLEIQSENLEDIARASVVNAFQKCRLPVIVEDAGLFVDILKGFPGPYAAYLYKTIGNRGLLRLMRGFADRKAEFRSVIAYESSTYEQPICFGGEAAGQIVREERRGAGDSGFGFDPVFRPLNSDKTFAEMDIVEKNTISHRADALRKFAKWYRKLSKPSN